MRALRVCLVAVLAVCAASAPAPAQTTGSGLLQSYEVTTWNESHGVPPGRIRAIRQDARGYLWLATDVGLVRFDGVGFDRWADREARLPDGAATALLASRDRSLWVGVIGDRPIVRLRDRKLTFYGAHEGFNGVYVNSLIEDRHDTVWAATGRGLYHFEGGRWAQVASDDGIGSDVVLSVFEDQEGNLWVGTRSAVFRRDAGGARFGRVATISVSSNVWQHFGQDVSGNVWITDFQSGLRRPGEPADGVSPRGWGVALLRDRRGDLWVGTQGQGLWRVRKGGGEHPSFERIGVADGLISNAVQSLWEDREGNLWLGTLAGLQRLTPHGVTPIRDLPIPRAIAATPDGDVWVGTAAGLTRFSESGRRDYSEEDALPGSLVMALYADKAGGLWVSTEAGLTRFFEEQFSPVLVKPDGQVQRILWIAGSEGDLWLRDFGSKLFRWRDGRLQRPEDVPPPYAGVTRAIYTDARNRLWIGSDGGQVAVKDPDGDVHLHELEIGHVTRFFEDAGGTMWVGGQDGLSHFDGERWVTANRINGFPGGVTAINEDDSGYIWVGARTGILRLERTELGRIAADRSHQLRFRLFNSADGAAGVPVADAVRSADGRLWFVTSNGITVVAPDDLPPPRPTPRVRIESVIADARPFDPVQQLSLPPQTSHLQFGFAALTLSDPTRVQFRYRLDGFDTDWVDGGSARVASYTNLPPREYRFRVAASAGDGAWGEAGRLTFRIAPTFYQTNAFYAGGAGVLLLAAYSAWRLRVRHVRREFELVLAERFRMSRAIHDTVLQGMAALALQVNDLTHSLDTASPGHSRAVHIRRQLERYVREARQSVWLLRSPDWHSRDLSRALRDTAKRATTSASVSLDVSIAGTPRPVDASIEEHVLLIAQEAIANAVRHAKATRISVALEYRADGLRLRVADDGCGFDAGKVSHVDGHYGLISMRERAGQLRGRLSVVSTPGAGTEVEAVVPTAGRSLAREAIPIAASSAPERQAY